MAIWLLKTEPDHYSFADLQRDGETVWDGVKQPLALQYLRLIQEGDVAIIYHTGTERACIGTAKVTRGAYADPQGDDEKWAVCDVRAGEPWKRAVTLQQIKACDQLQDWDLVRLPRLSVVPVTETQVQVLAGLANQS